VEAGEKNGKTDLPIKSVHAIWFAKAAGPSAITVDALTATTILGSAPEMPLQAQMSGADWDEPGKPLSSQLVITNFSEMRCRQKWNIPSSGCRRFSCKRRRSDSWLRPRARREKLDGSERQSRGEGSLTDDKDWTNVRPSFGKEKGTEAFQFVDLGRERRINRLTYLSGMRMGVESGCERLVERTAVFPCRRVAGRGYAKEMGAADASGCLAVFCALLASALSQRRRKS
jgi:hypothetical protein